MADKNPALDVVRRIVMMCDFIDHPAVIKAVEQAVPVTMPRAPGALGFDIPLWVGLGTVGLWAAPDGFYERTGLPKLQCNACRRCCIHVRFAPHAQGNEGKRLEELEDLRHLYAHNCAGEADSQYLSQKRHVLVRNSSIQLTCGAQFTGQRVQLDLSHLRMYAQTVQSVLHRFR